MEKGELGGGSASSLKTPFPLTLPHGEEGAFSDHSIQAMLTAFYLKLSCEGEGLERVLEVETKTCEALSHQGLEKLL